MGRIKAFLPYSGLNFLKTNQNKAKNGRNLSFFLVRKKEFLSKCQSFETWITAFCMLSRIGRYSPLSVFLIQAACV